jgi:hypothetical protein
MVTGVAIGAIYLIAVLIRRIKNRLGAREQRLVVFHVADLVPRMTHHTGRIYFRLGVHNLRRRDIVFVAAMPFGFAVASFAADAGLFVRMCELLVAETVVTRTAKNVGDKALFLRGFFCNLMLTRIFFAVFMF